MAIKKWRFEDPTGEFEHSVLELPVGLEASPTIAVYTREGDVIYLDRVEDE